MKTLAIFDLDGTLLNTISDLGQAVNYALERCGYSTHPVSAYNYMVGNGVRRLIERSAPDAEGERLKELHEYFLEYYTPHCTDTTHPYEGIHDLLRDLRDRNVAIAVATNKYQDLATKIITHFFPDIEFVAILGQVPDRPIKPDPSVVFSILNIRPTPKTEVLYIGDSAVDMETARRACVESIGVTWGFRPVSELRQAMATHIVSRPDEILDHLSDPF